MQNTCLGFKDSGPERGLACHKDGLSVELV